MSELESNASLNAEDQNSLDITHPVLVTLCICSVLSISEANVRNIWIFCIYQLSDDDGDLSVYCFFFWLSLGNLVIENKPTPSYTPNVVVGQTPPGTNHVNKAPGQINLAQLRLQHMQQQVYAQKHQQMQQMRMAQPTGSVPRQTSPQVIQQQVSILYVVISCFTVALRVKIALSNINLQSSLWTWNSFEICHTWNVTALGFSWCL